MVITAEVIIALITILTPFFGGAIWFWNSVEKRLGKQDAETVARVEAVKELNKITAGRLDTLEKTTVTKDDYIQDRQSTDRAIENIALSLREGLATVTGRIDLVLFEVGRNRSDKSDH